MNIQPKALLRECEALRRDFGEDALSFSTALEIVKAQRSPVNPKHCFAMMQLMRNTARRRHLFRFSRKRA